MDDACHDGRELHQKQDHFLFIVMLDGVDEFSKAKRKKRKKWKKLATFSDD
jgi:hypothetical protein